MRAIAGCVRKFWNSEDGPTTTEYAIMLALIVIVCIGAISEIGTKVDAVFTDVDNGVPAGSGS